MATEDKSYMGKDAKEVLNVLRGMISAGQDAGARELTTGFYQYHSGNVQTEVKITVRF